MENKLFSRDFTWMVVGQIISLFGNAAVRFALPLYLLNVTGSAALYGAVTACAMLPMVALLPVGGLAADRANKRNIMVLLDFLTAALLLGFLALRQAGGLTVTLTVTLMLLYGISGVYQPAVQASIPALIGPARLTQANAVVNSVSSLAALLGPVLGGILYSACGLTPVLAVCAGCFFASAVMECFLHIPHVRRPRTGSLWATARADLGESARFLRREKPWIGKMVLTMCGCNFFLSAMILVGLPYLVTEALGFPAAQANRLYGFAQGALAAGGLLGGILAGVLAGRVPVRRAGARLVLAAALTLPAAAVLAWNPGRLAVYGVLTGCFCALMVCASLFSVQMTALLQAETPPALVGKVLSLAMTTAMCAQPLGSALYGGLFELLQGWEFVPVLAAGAATLALAAAAGHILRQAFAMT